VDVLAHRHAADAGDLGVTLAAGRRPPMPGLAPCDSLSSIARTGADATDARNFSMLKPPRASRQPK
jgi:hypothetical protein